MINPNTKCFIDGLIPKDKNDCVRTILYMNRFKLYLDMSDYKKLSRCLIPRKILQTSSFFLRRILFYGRQSVIAEVLASVFASQLLTNTKQTLPHTSMVLHY